MMLELAGLSLYGCSGFRAGSYFVDLTIFQSCSYIVWLKNSAAIFITKNSETYKMNNSLFDSDLWSFEVTITEEDGSRHFFQYARRNDDETVSYLWFELPGGFFERVVLDILAGLKERPWETDRRWQLVFQESFGEFIS